MIRRSLQVCSASLIFLSLFSSPFAHAEQPGEKNATVAKPKKTKHDENNLSYLNQLGFKPTEHRVSITGRATNDQGDSVANARIYVTPVARSGFPGLGETVLAEGTTDAEGNYRFDDVELTVFEPIREQAVPQPAQADFQIFGLAEGYGYTWRRSHSYRPEKRPEEKGEPAKYVFYADEPIKLDLVFSPEIRLHGIVIDDRGNPIENAIIQVGLINTGRELPTAPPNMWGASYLKDSSRADDAAFNGFHSLPEIYRLARTDAQGHYEIPGLPRDAELMTNFDYLPECKPWIDRINTGAKKLPNGDQLMFSGILNRTIEVPQPVEVVVTDAEGKPLENTVVRILPQQTIQRGGTLTRTDDQGVAVIKVPRGKIKLFVEPGFDQPFLPVQQAMTVDREPIKQPLEFRLNPATEVTFEAVEKESGKPIAGIAFLKEAAESRERVRVQSQLSFVDHPVTGRTGNFKACLAPGEWVFYVDRKHSDPEFEPTEPSTEIITLEPGEPRTIRFEFTRRKQPESPDNPFEAISAELKPFADLLDSQQQRFQELGGMRMHLRHSNYVMVNLDSEELTRFLDSFESKSIEECLEAIRQVSPGFGLQTGTTLVTDGKRRRVEFHYPDKTAPHVMVFNGEELTQPMDSGRQLDLYSAENAMIHFLDRNDFWYGPAQSYLVKARRRSEGKKQPERTIDRVNDNWVIEIKHEQAINRVVVDAATGFTRQNAIMDQNRKTLQEVRAYFPTILPNGVAAPRLSIKANPAGESKLRVEITIIDQIEMLDELPPDVFVIGAAAGTNVLDYRRVTRDNRNQGQHAPSGVLYGEVADIFAYRNQFAPPTPPVLKTGDMAPKFTIEGWVNSDGKIDTPKLEQKIIVIDFWGIGCGPCVAQLPEVNAAAKHFADTEIAVIGMHTAGSSPETVAEFAKEHELLFAHALDSIDPTRRTFGVTHAAFGIEGIPTSVVIDRTGHVAYIGMFKHAIEAANELAKAKQP